MDFKNNINSIAFHSFEVVGKYIYFSAIDYNGLYKYNLETQTNEFVSFFSDELIEIRHLHGAVKCVDKKLYFAPMSGKNISIYDIERENFKTVNVSEKIGDTSSKYYDILEHNDILIFIPTRSEYIITINSKTYEVNYWNEWTKYINVLQKQEIPLIKNGSFILDNKLYMPYCRDGIIIKVDLESFCSDAVRVCENKNGFVDAIFNNDQNEVLLLVNGEASIVRYKLDNGQVDEYKSKFDMGGIKFPYQQMFDIGDKILILNYRQEYSIIYEKSTNLFKIFNIEDYNSEYLREWDAYYYAAKKLSDDKILIISTGDYHILTIDYKLNITDFFYITDDRIMAKILKKTRKTLIKEEECDLNNYLEYIKEG